MEHRKSNAIRPKKPGLYLKPKKTIVPIVDNTKKSVTKKIETKPLKSVNAQLRLEGSQLILEKDNKKVKLSISNQQIEMLKVAFKEIV